MITASPRAGRSHRFDINSLICRCGRPLEYFHRNGWGYCSTSWTGRPAQRQIVRCWDLAGIAKWDQAGSSWQFVLGPITALHVGRCTIVDFHLFNIGIVGRRIRLVRR